MDLLQLQAEHLRKYQDMKRQTEKEKKDDISLARRIIEQIHSSESSNHVQTSQSVQPYQRSEFSLFIQHNVAETNANVTVQCFPMDLPNNLHFKVKALITPLLNSTPNQLAPFVKKITPDNPCHSKDWYESFPQDLRRHFIQRLVKEMAPRLSSFEFQSMNYIVGRARNYEGHLYNTANSKEEYYQLFADKIFAVQKLREEMKRKQIDEKMRTPKDSSWKNKEKMLMLLRKEAVLLAHLTQTSKKELELLNPKNSSSLSEEQIKEIQLSKENLEKQLKCVSNKLIQVKKMAVNLSSFVKGENPSMQTKQTPSEVAVSIRNCNHFEERRHRVREEVSANRRDNQLKAANLNRGLVMDIDEGASKSDRTFDLTTLDEALPPVSNCKRAPRMTRTLKLQDIIMNNMKENRFLRLAALKLSSIDTATGEDNS